MWSWRSQLRNPDFIFTIHLYPSSTLSKPPSTNRKLRIQCSVRPDPFSLSDGNSAKPKPKSKNPKNPLSDDNARRIIKKKAQYLSALRRNQGPRATTPKWIKRTPEQMVKYLEDERNGELYGKHVVAAIKAVRAMGQRKEWEVDVRGVMGSFVGKLNFREMCVVLKEQKNWRQVRDFFVWMKLQVSFFYLVFLMRVQFDVGRKWGVAESREENGEKEKKEKEIGRR
ncbi:hypothetical protein V6N13_117596 [Hibiscus sabdariffa]